MARPSTTVALSDAERRARARDKVRRAANTGKGPFETFSEADLDWAFADCKPELDELERRAEAERLRRQEREESAGRGRELREMTEQIIREQDAERWAAAKQEARRRLGWDE